MLKRFSASRAAACTLALFASLVCLNRQGVLAADPPLPSVYLSFVQHENEEGVVECWIVNASGKPAAIAVNVQPVLFYEEYYKTGGESYGGGGLHVRDLGNPQRYVLLLPSSKKIDDPGQVIDYSMKILRFPFPELGEPGLKRDSQSIFEAEITLSVLVPDEQTQGLKPYAASFTGKAPVAEFWKRPVALRREGNEGEEK